MTFRAAARTSLLLAAVAACSDDVQTGHAVGPDPNDVRSSDPALAEAQSWLASEVAAQPGQHRAIFRSKPVELPVPSTIDIESASSAEGEIEFVRLVTGADVVRFERVVFRGPDAGRERATGRVETSSAPSATLRHLLDAIRVLPGLHVVPRPDSPDGAPSSDFFRLVRIHGTEGVPDAVFEYAGRLGERGAPEFAGPRAIAARASSILKSLRWEPVGEGDWRSSHYTDAFRRNRERFAHPGRDWLVERCVEALAWFGSPPAADTVRWLREKAGRLEPRILARMHILSEDPDRYLDGPPKELPAR